MFRHRSSNFICKVSNRVRVLIANLSKFFFLEMFRRCSPCTAGTVVCLNTPNEPSDAVLRHCFGMTVWELWKLICVVFCDGSSELLLKSDSVISISDLSRLQSLDSWGRANRNHQFLMLIIIIIITTTNITGYDHYLSYRHWGRCILSNGSAVSHYNISAGICNVMSASSHEYGSNHVLMSIIISNCLSSFYELCARVLIISFAELFQGLVVTPPLVATRSLPIQV